MKKNQTGSILIWTLFLMFFVLSSFFYMSLRIKTKIQSPSTQNQQEKQIVMQKVFQNSFSGNLAQNQVWNMSFSLSQTGTLFVGT
jgi:flagellar basal body-associated protein FliL